MLAFPFREGKLRVGVRAGIRALSLRTLPLRDSAGLDLSRGVTGLSPFGTAHPGAGAPSPQPLLDYHNAPLYHVRRSESNLAMRRSESQERNDARSLCHVVPLMVTEKTA